MTRHNHLSQQISNSDLLQLQLLRLPDHQPHHTLMENITSVKCLHVFKALSNAVSLAFRYAYNNTQSKQLNRDDNSIL